jgi:hypothetical protein
MNMAERFVVAALAASFTAGFTTLLPANAADAQPCTPQERANQTLSQKLDQTSGVICPPDIDPAMKAPTPKAGNTPVIRPPGSPGGDPSVQPN